MHWKPHHRPRLLRVVLDSPESWTGTAGGAAEISINVCREILLNNENTMKTVSVRELNRNPSAALRAARENPVVVLRRQHPEAVLMHLEGNSILDNQGIRLALATALYREGSVSLGRAARFSELPLADFIQHVSLLGISVTHGTASSARQDVDAIQKWRQHSSSAMQAL